LAGVHRLLADRLSREVTIVDLFRFPTVADLAEHLEREDDGGAARREVQDRAERQRQAKAARQQRGRESRR
ncbi:MAG TPA: hypothetical protein VFQ39_20395, partial [Longimicrobium sp.]|nr:hypothetical protein [Longimicrobium sp.]